MQRLKLPSIIGFLITGVLIGPYGFSLVNAVDEVEILSEIGVILLLFVIGLYSKFRPDYLFQYLPEIIEQIKSDA